MAHCHGCGKVGTIRTALCFDGNLKLTLSDVGPHSGYLENSYLSAGPLSRRLPEKVQMQVIGQERAKLEGITKALRTKAHWHLDTRDGRS